MKTRSTICAALLSLALSATAFCEPAANTWTQVTAGRTGSRSGSVLIHGSDGKLLLLGGSVSGAP